MTRSNRSPTDDLADAGYVMGSGMAMRIYIPKSMGQPLAIGPAFAFAYTDSSPLFSDRIRDRNAFLCTKFVSWSLQMRQCLGWTTCKCWDTLPGRFLKCSIWTHWLNELTLILIKTFIIMILCRRLNLKLNIISAASSLVQEQLEFCHGHYQRHMHLEPWSPKFTPRTR